MRQQKRRGLIYGMVSIGLAVLTGLLFSSQIAALEQQIGDRQQIVVAKTTIAPRTLITPEVLEVKEIPRMWAHPSYVQSIDDIVNQRVAVVQIDQGAIIRQNDIASTSGLDDGWRAVSIGVNPVAVLADGVTNGSRVDVVVSYETTFLDERGQEITEKRTRTLLTDIEVLSVAGAPQRAVARQPQAVQESGGLFGGGGTNPQPSEQGTFDDQNVVIATLRVKPGDAQQLAYMDTYANDIRLALRRPDDRAVEPIPPISEEDYR